MPPAFVTHLLRTRRIRFLAWSYFLTSLPCSKAHSGSHLSITSTLKSKASSHHSPPLSQTQRICPGSTSNSLCLTWRPPCLGVAKYFSFYVCTLSRLFFPRGSPWKKGRRRKEMKEAGLSTDGLLSGIHSPPPSHSQTGKGSRTAEKRRGGEAWHGFFEGHERMIYCCVYRSCTLLLTIFPSLLTHLHLLRTGFNKNGWGQGETPRRPQHTFL